VLNLGVNALQKSGQLQAVKITEQEKNLQGLSADLENFRGQLTRANNELRETSGKLQLSERDAAQLTSERDQLKESIAKWSTAVQLRDERIAEANDRILEIGERLKDGAEKFNRLATRYNDTVRQMDELTVKYNGEQSEGSTATSVASLSNAWILRVAQDDNLL
jgi:chromosome segregation ATPase